MYEFEGLLFSDPQRFASGIDQLQLATAFSAIRKEFDTPEEINDSPMTAPSKRIDSSASRFNAARAACGSFIGTKPGRKYPRSDVSIATRACADGNAYFQRISRHPGRTATL